MGPAPLVIGAQNVPGAEPQVSAADGRGTGRGTPGDVPRLTAFPQVSACRVGAAHVPRHQVRAAVRSVFLHPLRLVPVRPGGQRTSVDGTPRGPGRRADGLGRGVGVPHREVLGEALGRCLPPEPRVAAHHLEQVVRDVGLGLVQLDAERVTGQRPGLLP